MRRFAMAAAALGLVTVGCETDAGGGLRAGRERGLAVVCSDYASTAVSLVDPATGELAADSFLHSGTRDPVLTTALSGDVMLAGSSHPDGLLPLIDRFPNAALSLVDPVTLGVVDQVSVGTGFASNPQDVVFLADGRAYVSRLEANPYADSDMPYDEGDDLLILGAEQLRPVGRIALTGEASGEGELLARPARMTTAGGLVWVVLGCLSDDFSRGGEGVVVGVDPSQDDVVARVVLPEGANCYAVARAPSGGALWVACSGVPQEGPERQLARSGLARIDVIEGAPTLGGWWPAASLVGRPLGLDLAVDRDGRVFAVAYGALADDTPDRLFVLDPFTGDVETVYEGAAPFSLGGLVVDADVGRLWLGDGDPTGPRLLGWLPGETPWAEPLVGGACPATGLPPRSIAGFGRTP